MPNTVWTLAGLRHSKCAGVLGSQATHGFSCPVGAWLECHYQYAAVRGRNGAVPWKVLWPAHLLGVAFHVPKTLETNIPSKFTTDHGAEGLTGYIRKFKLCS